MVKKIGIILFFVAAVGARHAVPLQGLPLLSDTAFADSYTQDSKPCPPECVSDSMEIVTWYPSPYNEYEELRLYPISESNSPNGECGQDNRGLMYYDKDDDKVYICKGAIEGWKELGGSGNLPQSTTSSSFCDSNNLGKLIYDTSRNRPYVCALNGSSYVWKPLDSDYDRDGVTDAVDANDNDFNDATATAADVLQGKTFYAGGQARTGTMAATLTNEGKCNNAGGSWVASQSICYFSGSSCPSGFLPSGFTSTMASSCGPTGQCSPWQGVPDSCVTGSHSRSSIAVESCAYRVRVGYWGCGAVSCTASVTEMGCMP